MGCCACADRKAAEENLKNFVILKKEEKGDKIVIYYQKDGDDGKIVKKKLSKVKNLRPVRDKSLDESFESNKESFSSNERESLSSLTRSRYSSNSRNYTRENRITIIQDMPAYHKDNIFK
jgi:hypothetical protein